MTANNSCVNSHIAYERKDRLRPSLHWEPSQLFFDLLKTRKHYVQSGQNLAYSNPCLSRFPFPVKAWN